jgi:hypothetical protein
MSLRAFRIPLGAREELVSNWDAEIVKVAIAPVAQGIECRASNAKVAGSTPAGRANDFRAICLLASRH